MLSSVSPAPGIPPKELTIVGAAGIGVGGMLVGDGSTTSATVGVGSKTVVA
jgi:hypothetical protein